MSKSSVAKLARHVTEAILLHICANGPLRDHSENWLLIMDFQLKKEDFAFNFFLSARMAIKICTFEVQE